MRGTYNNSGNGLELFERVKSITTEGNGVLSIPGKTLGKPTDILKKLNLKRVFEPSSRWTLVNKKWFNLV